MGNVNNGVWFFLVLVLAIGLALLFFKRRELRKAAIALAETFREEINNPRGPTTPMHPSPAGDDALLRHRSSKNVES